MERERKPLTDEQVRDGVLEALARPAEDARGAARARRHRARRGGIVLSAIVRFDPEIVDVLPRVREALRDVVVGASERCSQEGGACAAMRVCTLLLPQLDVVIERKDKNAILAFGMEAVFSGRCPSCGAKTR